MSTLDASRRVQLLGVYEHMRRVFRQHKKKKKVQPIKKCDVLSISRELVNLLPPFSSPRTTLLKKDSQFFSFGEQTLQLDGAACFFDDRFSIFETLKHPLFAGRG